MPGCRCMLVAAPPRSAVKGELLVVQAAREAVLKRQSWTTPRMNTRHGRVRGRGSRSRWVAGANTDANGTARVLLGFIGRKRGVRGWLRVRVRARARSSGQNQHLQQRPSRRYSASRAPSGLCGPPSAACAFSRARSIACMGAGAGSGAGAGTVASTERRWTWGMCGRVGGVSGVLVARARARARP